MLMRIVKLFAITYLAALASCGGGGGGGGGGDGKTQAALKDGGISIISTVSLRGFYGTGPDAITSFVGYDWIRLNEQGFNVVEGITFTALDYYTCCSWPSSNFSQVALNTTSKKWELISNDSGFFHPFVFSSPDAITWSNPAGIDYKLQVISEESLSGTPVDQLLTDSYLAGTQLKATSGILFGPTAKRYKVKKEIAKDAYIIYRQYFDITDFYSSFRGVSTLDYLISIASANNNAIYLRWEHSDFKLTFNRMTPSDANSGTFSVTDTNKLSPNFLQDLGVATWRRVTENGGDLILIEPPAIVKERYTGEAIRPILAVYQNQVFPGVKYVAGTVSVDPLDEKIITVNRAAMTTINENIISTLK